MRDQPVLVRALRSAALVSLSALAVAGLSACQRAESQPGAAAMPPPPVTVAAARETRVSDWAEFTGRFEAVERVELRPRVSGYIDEVRFVEGAEVRKGEVLFVIDPRPYQAELERAEGELARLKAAAVYAQSEAQRAARLLDSRAISQEERDARVSQESQAQAGLRSAQGAVDAARLNLEFTRVVSPIAGRVSRTPYTKGNYVSAGTQVLTSVVALDPIYVSFDGDERSYLDFRQDPGAGKAATPVYVGLANESGFPHEGKLNFIDNALDPASGTIRVRALLPNPQRHFTPGLFARVRLPGGEPYAATVIPEAAIGTDQDRRFVLVVGADGTVEYRPVQLGTLHGSDRVVSQGLKPGEQVVTGGMHRARPGSKVTPQLAAPAAAPAAGDAAAAQS